MENLQKLVPIFKDLMHQWYDLTMHNQEYATCLAISVWLLTAIFYSIRIGFLKSSKAQLLKAHQLVQTSLGEAETQVQALQQQLNEAGENLQQTEQKVVAETQRATGLEQRLNSSNQQLASSLSSLVTCFELNQNNLPAANADNLLSEYAAVIARVAERFQTEQQAKTQLQLSMHAEAAKLAEKQELLDSLQSRLDTQTQQMAQLEMAVEKYEAAERQMELDQQQFALERQKHQAEAARLAEMSKPVAFDPQPQPVIAEKKPDPFAAAPIAKPIEEVEKIIEPQVVVVEKPAVVQVAEPKASVLAQPAPAQQPKTADNKKTKGFFGRAMEKITKLDEKLGMQPAVSVTEPELDGASVQQTVVDVEKTEPATPVTTTETKPKSAAPLNQKLTGLLGGLKKSPAKADEPAKQPEPVTIETIAEAAVEAVPEKLAASGEKAAGKLSGMFNKFKSKK